jgi:hypothetical protein
MGFVSSSTLPAHTDGSSMAQWLNHCWINALEMRVREKTSCNALCALKRAKAGQGHTAGTCDSLGLGLGEVVHSLGAKPTWRVPEMHYSHPHPIPVCTFSGRQQAWYSSFSGSMSAMVRVTSSRFLPLPSMALRIRNVFCL